MNFHEIKLITSLTTSKYFSVDADSIRYPEQVYTPGRTLLNENQFLIREFANFAKRSDVYS